MSINDKFISSQVTTFQDAASNNVNSNLYHAGATTTKQPKLTDKPLDATSQIKLTTTESSVTCSWQYVQYATSYILERADDAIFSINLGTLYSGAGNAFIDSTTKAGTTYYYRVTTAATGYYGKSVTSSITTLNQIPAGNLTLSGIDDTRITLSWLPISGASSYIVEKSTNSDFSSGVSTIYTGSNLTVNATALTQSTHYYFRLHGTGTGHTVVNYAFADASTVASLAAPTLSFGTIGDTQIVINWTSVSGATSYGLERSPNGTNSWMPLYSGTALTLTDSSLTASTTYYYRVHGIAENELAVTYGTANTTTNAALTAPSVPVASGVTTNSMILTWGSVNNATGYVLQRSTSGGSAFTTSTNIFNGSALTFTDTGLTTGTTYYYRVYATAPKYANSVVSTTCTQITS